MRRNRRGVDEGGEVMVTARTTKKRRASRPTANAVTVGDVAREAGVSVATVSRVLNGNQTVAEALRAQVRAAASRLGYMPHAAARALASQRSRNVGAIVPTIENVNFSATVSALQRRLTAAGYTLLLGSSNFDVEEEARQVRALASHGIAGLMLVGSQRDGQIYELLREQRIPFVNAWVLDGQHPCVGVDNQDLGRTLANHLLDQGHRAFGVIMHALSDRSLGRLVGIRDALHARGVPFPQERLLHRTATLADGQAALRSLMSGSSPPTAILCGNDTIAFGALVEARAMGIDVPGQLSVTGVNDNDFSAYLDPPLTTIAIPAREIGELTADYLLGCIEGRPTAPFMPVRFRLVTRGSTAPPPGAVAAPA